MSIRPSRRQYSRSISVLTRAASASIYGSQQVSNGVILITTKRGQKGKITTTYSEASDTSAQLICPNRWLHGEYLQAELNAWIMQFHRFFYAQEPQLQQIEEQNIRPDNWNRYDSDWKDETMKVIQSCITIM
ncbi:TonB-dependent receptor, partial [Bacteroides sp. BFG-638]|nr:TonB-dependent receptor [Bacteroides sp. BFG-638]